jgi:hypothetical protein
LVFFFIGVSFSISRTYYPSLHLFVTAQEFNRVLTLFFMLSPPVLQFLVGFCDKRLIFLFPASENPAFALFVGLDVSHLDLAPLLAKPAEKAQKVIERVGMEDHDIPRPVPPGRAVPEGGEFLPFFNQDLKPGVLHRLSPSGLSGPE